ncbi:pyridoxal-phosphate-dependent aminotransferase family protein [Haliovirga abyssi]|uniref:Class V aminotransferase n=1 Tax=Haliovirga abyssi TaxID=2996794 RepID=A0AAU9DAC5_9FUSO|nr:alanine--glyoxylate aminotransferase family protein [Haliovirga abyssi]BDU50556.1 class V aminotransferase [Haliovirga abyssi]
MKNLLMTPGPTPIPEEARFAMAKSIIHHRTDEYSEIFKELSKNLKYLFKTENPVITLTSSGTGGMEASVANLFSKGDKVVVVSVGNFGERFVKLCDIYGLEVVKLSYNWGEAAKANDLKEVLAKEEGVKGVFLTHHETSTGVLNDVKSFGEILKGTDILFVVDTISGLIANEFETDNWGVDCAVAGSQKGFMAPPGLAFVSLSEKAQKALDKSDLPKFYFSFKNTLNRLPEGQNPTTPAVNLIIATNEACKMLKKEGLENVTARHKNLKEAVAIGIKALGLEFFVKDEAVRGNTVTAVVAPEGVDGQAVNNTMRDKYGITIAGGQGAIKGKIFRLGHLGDVDRFDVLSLFSALEMTLNDLGYKGFEAGSSLKAIQKYYLR